MGAYVLNGTTTLLCPHGGVVVHTPTSLRHYTIAGAPVMLVNDNYTVASCPLLGTPYLGCTRVVWTSPSTTLHVRGVPALVNTSIGLLMHQASGPMGMVIVANFQTEVMEPDTFTNKD